MSDFSKGLEGIVAAETNMSFIDGQKGILEYVGIPIGDLASLEPEAVVHLLLERRLPEDDELAAFKAEDLEELRSAAATVSAIVDTEMGVHVAFCERWGMSEVERLCIAPTTR